MSKHPGEAQIQDDVRKELGNPSHYPDVVLWRNNIGMLFDRENKPVRFGVANPGGADLLGIFTTSSGVGIFVAAEIKTAIGHQSDEQRRFEQLITSKGAEYVVLRSVGDAQRWVASLRRKYAKETG